LPNGKKISVAEIEMKGQTFEYQKDQFRKIMKSGLPVIRACMDQSGMGEPLAEELQKEFGSAKVEGLQLLNAPKEMLAIGMKTGLEKLEFMLNNDSKLQRQIHSIKRTAISGGSFRYDSERDEDGHADSFWALALANHAIIEVKQGRPGFYQQLKARKEQEQTAKEAGSATTAQPVKPTRTKGKSLSALNRNWRVR
jgi:phage FluMu gp28-like protein